jgi:hypothetical protein
MIPEKLRPLITDRNSLPSFLNDRSSKMWCVSLSSGFGTKDFLDGLHNTLTERSVGFLCDFVELSLARTFTDINLVMVRLHPRCLLEPGTAPTFKAHYNFSKHSSTLVSLDI